MQQQEASRQAQVRIAVVDDDPQVCAIVQGFLEQAGCQVSTFAAPLACLAAIRPQPPDILITDVQLPEMDGLQLLREVKSFSPSTDVIVITGGAHKDVAIRALKLGAFDFFEKPVVAGELVETVRRTMRYRTALAERDQFARQLSFVSQREAQRWGLDAFVGESPAVRRILADVRRLQQAPHTAVLLTGASGTGKELVARAIHFGSARASRPFVPVNCPAIPAELAESALFGHVRGAFTGATSDQKGSFELAHEGTLFLDEIGDMPPLLQAKLLRVLEDGVVVPVGRTAGRAVDVRVIAATNADLQARIASGRFRADLFYRLAGFALELPPLRERGEDVVLLARHFVGVLATEMGLTPPVLTDEALARLRQHSFPGNVRELKNMIERALIRSGGQDIRAAHLEVLDVAAAAPGAANASVSAPAPGAPPELPINLAAAEQLVIRRALQTSNGNVSQAARLLGISRSKLNRKLALLSPE
jgi:DNA-binding NtrC family response regulator